MIKLVIRKSQISVNLRARLQKTVSPAFVKTVNTEIVEEIKRKISIGSSPVSGRFVAYTNPKRYPGKKKPAKPVNLYLSGVMLSWLKAFKQSTMTLGIGIPSSAPKEVKARALANNVGTKTIPARRFIPIKGETFALGILRKLNQIYTRRFKEVLNSRR